MTDTSSARREAPDSAGLTSAEAARRLIEYGENRIGSGRSVSALPILVRNFSSPLVIILLVAAVLAAALGELIDAAAIAVIVVLNAILGFVQEWRAERAIEALRDMLAPMAEVIRDGRPMMLPADELVPGDLVVLSEGQKVPADIRLMTAAGLRLDESILTGESVPVDRGPQDPEPRAFMGTMVVGGRGEGVVVATGSATSFGQIAQLTEQVGEKTTRLQRQLARLGRQLGFVGMGVAGAILVIGLIAGRDLLDMVLTALSMAVAVVPEGLPVVVTLTLAIGASAMVRQKALLRRLQAAETLGAASVICTDKTGTLTENKMTATVVATPDARYEVTGTGYDPAGRILRDGQPVRAADDPDLARLLHAAQVCNDAKLDRQPDWTMIGDPTEGALITLAMKAWAPIPDRNARSAEAPFSSERKRMGVVAPDGAGQPTLCVKGAPEAVLAACSSARIGGQDLPLGAEQRNELDALQGSMAEQGLRVIAIAARRAETPEDLKEANLTLLGFAGLLDPPRPEVADAVRACHGAGIRVVMITGDSVKTGQAIAAMVGLRANRAISGAELDAMDDEALAEAVRQDVIFARTAPIHKTRIVESLQSLGAIVAMTGDGVNDAPALRKADIGMAMGQRGTDVAKEAADLVLLDDNFATILRAIAEGRRQFANIRKFVRYLLSSNSAEATALSLNLLIGGPLILLPFQILWLNLLTDGVSAVALGLEPGEPEQMRRPPLHRDETVLTRKGVLGMAAFGGYMAAACLGLFYHYLPQDEILARTVAFTALVLMQEIAVFAFRSDTRSAWAIGMLSNPWLVLAVAGMIGLQALALYWAPLQTILGTVALGWADLGVIALTCLPLVVAPGLSKALRRRVGAVAGHGA
ncbi:MAG: ATPase P [Rhodobacteraceae bacterium]|nr:ATPase P [Paracoccaceae bacterium]MAY47020.1 ATPase P [Paracoccaceae bacterium]